MSWIRQGVLIISYIYISPTGPFVQKVDYAIHRKNLYPVDSVLVSPTCPLDSDLSVGQCYPMFEQLGPEGQMYAELPQNLDHWQTLPQIYFVFLLKFFYRNEWTKLCNYKDYN